MGFNKKMIGLENTYRALKLNKLNLLYHKSDSMIFDCGIPFEVYKLFCEGKTEKEIITLLNIEL